MQSVDVDVWGSEPQSPTSARPRDAEDPEQSTHTASGESSENGETLTRKFRGIPENVKLFEVFWQQIVELIKVRTRYCT